MADLGRLHASLSRVVLVGRDLRDVLDEIVAGVRDVVPGTDACSLHLVRGDRVAVVASDGALATDADRLQHQHAGPGLDAARSREVLLVEDTSTEQRWPDWCRGVDALGVAASLSIPLLFQDVVIGVLTTYAVQPRAYRDDAVALGGQVAAWVAVAVGNAEATARAVAELEQMRTAMRSRATIEQAKGILMERFKVSEQQAFTLLTNASQHTNTKLRLLADDLVATGVLPAQAPTAASRS